MGWGDPKHCKMCGTEIDKWGRAQTCSDVCRKGWSRRRDYVKRNKDSIMSALQFYRNYLKSYPDLKDELNSDLRYLQNEVRDLLNLRPDEEQMQLRAILEGQARKKSHQV